MSNNYPKISDTDFYKKINKKFKRYKIPTTKKSLKQICFPEKYEFQVPQKFLAEFINPNTPYKGILVYHRIGAGKTCTAINIAEKFKNKRRIMIVLPASLKGNIRSELRSPCGGNHYITSMEREKLKSLHPSDLEYKEIIRKSDDRIDKFYTIYSYNKFTELLNTGQLDLRNTLLLIDEVHNMVSETGTYYETLYKAVHTAPDSLRLVIMSATPIFDKPIEIALTMNLLRRDKQLPTGSEFINTFFDITYTKKGPQYTVKNMLMFKDFIKGFVSYYRGAPPHAFPKSEIHFVKARMSDKQLKLYKHVIGKEIKKNKVKDYVNTDISNSFFIGSRMVSNFTFPNNQIGEDGFDSLDDNDLDLANVKEFSPKFTKILRRVKKSDGTVFVYSNFKEFGGLRTFVRLLEHHRFKNYEYHGSGVKRFAIWSGDTNPNIREEIRAVFNSKNNEDGSQIKLILGSPSVKEGVSFLRIQEVHLIEPYWNFSRMDQIIGRAIRFCSHKDVELSKQLVKVYIYLSSHPTINRSIDEHIMKMALDKRYVNSLFERALKEAAIDCELFYNANVYKTDEDKFICDV